jgi:glycogen operon protein
LGVTPDARGVNVAVFSAHATAIEFCLFDGADREVERIRLPERTGDVFHGHIAGIGTGTRYGLRAHGPFAPREGHRFNANKLLIDPHARAIDRPFRLHPSMFPYPQGGDDLGFDATDSAAHMPKAVVTAPAGAASHRPLAAWSDTLLYELHVKGFTNRHPDVPADVRGTFAGLAHPAAIDHLVKLGITSVELMPTSAWIEERHLVGLGLSNYWGYNPVALAAPEPRLAPGAWAEVRRTVDALAAAGIETILDVVLNHSGEGDALGPTLSLRGLDNATYYRLHPEDPRRYIDDSGCGNTLALHRAPVLRMVMDALRTWVREAGVHGFRFDLATAMGRRPDGFDREAPLLAAIEQDPELRGLKLIAEPWDIGPGGYRVGHFPAGWGEWNDRFRDDVRRFWRGDAHHLGRLATRLAGSADLFGRNRPPSRSVNFLTAHDGFSLADLVSHETKKNEANGEQNRDGCGENWSWNAGCEGATDDPAILEARARDQRALLATLMFARGTPMLPMGAELGHSQQGNNNCYAQDNEISWLDWERADPELLAFAQRLGALRRSHKLLRRDRVLDEAEVEWLTADGRLMTPGHWDAADADSLQMILEGEGERLAILIHRGRAPRRFMLGGRWRVLADSAGEERYAEGEVEAAARSVLLLSQQGSRGARTETLARLAEAAGIQPEWWTVDGERHQVSDDTRRALLAAMRLPAGTEGEARDSLERLSEPRPLPACFSAREGEPTQLPVRFERWLTIDTPEPTRVRASNGMAILPPLPGGRYRVIPDDAEEFACRLTIAPPHAWLPESMRAGRKLWGIGAQLYSLRREGDQGIGDFTTFVQLATRAAAAGASAVGLNPLHALFREDRERASPYSPSDRRFLDPIYLNVPGVTAPPGERFVDYPEVWARKEAVLRMMFEPGSVQDAFDAWFAEEGDAVRTFATFCAISRAEGGAAWQAWRRGYRDPASKDVRNFAAAEAEEVRFHAWLQFLCERQLANACAVAPAMEIGLYRDLAVGAAPDGAEAWSSQHLLASGVSIGAPPDPFSPSGQVWSLPPPDPHALLRHGCDSYAELLRANMAYAGALRIDHAMGLSRLFWVPEGAEGQDGAYVSYPLDHLLAETIVASHEARCMVVGEDLGTVPEGFRERLSACGILGYRVMLLEREGRGFRSPLDYPPLSLACVTSHDLPTLAGWRKGADIKEGAALGLAEDPSAAVAEREEERAALTAMAGGEGPVDVHRALAAGESALVMVQADDLAFEEIAVNLPGTDRERPNWRRRLVPATDELFEGDAGAVLDAVARLRSPSGSAIAARTAED